MVETAKANNLNVYSYLYYLLLYMPGMEYKKYPELMDDMLPWS
ncbi:transposase domain-containing protein [Ruminiclostridium papyrosolvens]